MKTFSLLSMIFPAVLLSLGRVPSLRYHIIRRLLLVFADPAVRCCKRSVQQPARVSDHHHLRHDHRRLSVLSDFRLN